MKNVVSMADMKPLQVGVILEGIHKGVVVMRTASSGGSKEVMMLSGAGSDHCWTFLTTGVKVEIIDVDMRYILQGVAEYLEKLSSEGEIPMSEMRPLQEGSIISPAYLRGTKVKRTQSLRNIEVMNLSKPLPGNGWVDINLMENIMVELDKK